jgi:hypothetical protein
MRGRDNKPCKIALIGDWGLAVLYEFLCVYAGASVWELRMLVIYDKKLKENNTRT